MTDASEPLALGARGSHQVARIDPPSDDQLRMARMVLNGLTDVQRRAVYAVVLHEAGLEVRGEK